jgi:cytochrome c-type biogenesis protein CcmH
MLEMRRLKRIVMALALAGSLGAAAADPGERLSDPHLEARARALFRDVRCLVCQSQSIDESEASLAHDLRRLIRDQVAEGRSDDQIRTYLVERYGEFVLLSPRVSLANAVLWAGPMLVVFLGLSVLILRWRRPPVAMSDDLSPDEEAALQKLKDERAI